MKNFSSLYKILPSMVTIFGLCVGLIAIKFAHDGLMENALICVVMALIADALDGKLARFLGSSSDFGAHLDSLSDAINFGIVPAFLLFVWRGHESIFFELAIIIYTICIVSRLARFNVNIEDSQENNQSKSDYFLGVSAPFAAALLLLPIMMQIGDLKPLYNVFFLGDRLILIYIIFIAYLTISHVKTPALKNISMSRNFMFLLLILFVGIFYASFIMPWTIIPIIMLMALIYIPFYNVKFILQNKNNN